MVTFGPAKKVALAQMVLDELAKSIRQGEIRPGECLPGEYELMRQFKVGRSSIREAMRGLITMGLVETKVGRGAVVVSPTPNPFDNVLTLEGLQRSAILNLMEVRGALEGLAAKLAALHASSHEIAAMHRHALAVEKRIHEGRTYFQANSDFHMAIARGSHNDILAKSLGNIIGQIRTYRERLQREVVGMPRRDILEHRAILRAIHARDPERARRAMVRHIVSSAGVVRNFDPAKGEMPTASPTKARQHSGPPGGKRAQHHSAPSKREAAVSKTPERRQEGSAEGEPRRGIH